MKSILVLTSLLALPAAHADPAPGFQPCASWPQITSSSGPNLAATGLPFTLNLRFNCLLTDAYSIAGLNATYEGASGSTLIPTAVVYPFPLPAGDTLYQFLFKVPALQREGAYALSGCVRIQERASGTERCLPLPAQTVTVVGVP